jgi:hypothetical protein
MGDVIYPWPGRWEVYCTFSTQTLRGADFVMDFVWMAGQLNRHRLCHIGTPWRCLFKDNTNLESPFLKPQRPIMSVLCLSSTVEMAHFSKTLTRVPSQQLKSSTDHTTSWPFMHGRSGPDHRYRSAPHHRPDLRCFGGADLRSLRLFWCNFAIQKSDMHQAVKQLFLVVSRKLWDKSKKVGFGGCVEVGIYISWYHFRDNK